MKYYPYGGTRSGSVPTDILFTGQRLDDGIDLYYYGAMYYDGGIGRFISADTLVPNPMTPQAYNRYAYCLNNPLKYVDPSGLDVVLVGGNHNNEGKAAEEMAGWIDSLIASGVINTYEDTIYPIWDTDHGITWLGQADVDSRIDQIAGVMNHLNLTDIKIAGHSEGAAAVGVFFARGLASESALNNLEAVFLIDGPTTPSFRGKQIGIQNFNYQELSGLPGKLGDGVKTADIYNSLSFVHMRDIRGWEKNTYDVATWYDTMALAIADLTSISPLQIMSNHLASTSRYHESAPKDAIAVMQDILNQ